MTHMTRFIGQLPLELRHLLLILLSVVLSWASTVALPALREALTGQPLLGPLLLALVVAVLSWATPLVQGYGLGTVREDSRLP